MTNLVCYSRNKVEKIRIEASSSQACVSTSIPLAFHTSPPRKLTYRAQCLDSQKLIRKVRAITHRFCHVHCMRFYLTFSRSRRLADTQSLHSFSLLLRSRVARIELQTFLDAEQAKARVQSSIHTFTDRCWDQCIKSSIGSSFGRGEEACLTNCVER